VGTGPLLLVLHEGCLVVPNLLGRVSTSTVSLLVIVSSLGTESLLGESVQC